MTKFRIRACELKDANSFIALYHRHHKPVQGHRFSIGLWTDRLVGVVTVGRPVARHTNQHTIVEVTRLCTDGTQGACSALYAAAARAAKEIGYEKIQTFILNEESGISLKASGWMYESTSSGGDWTSKSKPNRRQDQPQTPKQKWSRLL